MHTPTYSTVMKIVAALTLTTLKANAERFSPFIGEDDVAAWCQREAEPMGKECEQVQVLSAQIYTCGCGCSILFFKVYIRSTNSLPSIQ